MSDINEKEAGRRGKHAAERLKQRFEARMISIEVELADYKKNNEEYIPPLNECIIVRDEQL